MAFFAHGAFYKPVASGGGVEWGERESPPAAPGSLVKPNGLRPSRSLRTAQVAELDADDRTGSTQVNAVAPPPSIPRSPRSYRRLRGEAEPESPTKSSCHPPPHRAHSINSPPRPPQPPPSPTPHGTPTHSSPGSPAGSPRLAPGAEAQGRRLFPPREVDTAGACRKLPVPTASLPVAVVPGTRGNGPLGPDTKRRVITAHTVIAGGLVVPPGAAGIVLRREPDKAGGFRLAVELDEYSGVTSVPDWCVVDDPRNPARAAQTAAEAPTPFSALNVAPAALLAYTAKQAAAQPGTSYRKGHGPPPAAFDEDFEQSYAAKQTTAQPGTSYRGHGPPHVAFDEDFEPAYDVQQATAQPGTSYRRHGPPPAAFDEDFAPSYDAKQTTAQPGTSYRGHGPPHVAFDEGFEPAYDVQQATAQPGTFYRGHGPPHAAFDEDVEPAYDAKRATARPEASYREGHGLPHAALHADFEAPGSSHGCSAKQSATHHLDTSSYRGPGPPHATFNDDFEPPHAHFLSRSFASSSGPKGSCSHRGSPGFGSCLLPPDSPVLLTTSQPHAATPPGSPVRGAHAARLAETPEKKDVPRLPPHLKPGAHGSDRAEPPRNAPQAAHPNPGCTRAQPAPVRWVPAAAAFPVLFDPPPKLAFPLGAAAASSPPGKRPLLGGGPFAVLDGGARLASKRGVSFTNPGASPQPAAESDNRQGGLHRWKAGGWLGGDAGPVGSVGTQTDDAPARGALRGGEAAGGGARNTGAGSIDTRLDGGGPRAHTEGDRGEARRDHEAGGSRSAATQRDYDDSNSSSSRNRNGPVETQTNRGYNNRNHNDHNNSSSAGSRVLLNHDARGGSRGHSNNQRSSNNNNSCSGSGANINQSCDNGTDDQPRWDRDARGGGGNPANNDGSGSNNNCRTSDTSGGGGSAKHRAYTNSSGSRNSSGGGGGGAPPAHHPAVRGAAKLPSKKSPAHAGGHTGALPAAAGSPLPSSPGQQRKLSKGSLDLYPHSPVNTPRGTLHSAPHALHWDAQQGGGAPFFEPGHRQQHHQRDNRHHHQYQHDFHHQHHDDQHHEHQHSNHQHEHDNQHHHQNQHDTHHHHHHHDNQHHQHQHNNRHQHHHDSHHHHQHGNHYQRHHDNHQYHHDNNHQHQHQHNNRHQHHHDSHHHQHGNHYQRHHDNHQYHHDNNHQHQHHHDNHQSHHDHHHQYHHDNHHQQQAESGRMREDARYSTQAAVPCSSCGQSNGNAASNNANGNVNDHNADRGSSSNNNSGGTQHTNGGALHKACDGNPAGAPKKARQRTLSSFFSRPPGGPRVDAPAPFGVPAVNSTAGSSSSSSSSKSRRRSNQATGAQGARPCETAGKPRHPAGGSSRSSSSSGRSRSRSNQATGAQGALPCETAGTPRHPTRPSHRAASGRGSPAQASLPAVDRALFDPRSSGLIRGLAHPTNRNPNNTAERRSSDLPGAGDDRQGPGLIDSDFDLLEEGAHHPGRSPGGPPEPRSGVEVNPQRSVLVDSDFGLLDEHAHGDGSPGGFAEPRSGVEVDRQRSVLADSDFDLLDQHAHGDRSPGGSPGSRSGGEVDRQRSVLVDSDFDLLEGGVDTDRAAELRSAVEANQQRSVLVDSDFDLLEEEEDIAPAERHPGGAAERGSSGAHEGPGLINSDFDLLEEGTRPPHRKPKRSLDRASATRNRAGSSGPQPSHKPKSSLDRAPATGNKVDNGPQPARKRKDSPGRASAARKPDGSLPVDKHKGGLDRASAAKKKVGRPIGAGSDGPRHQSSVKPASAAEVTGSDGPRPTRKPTGSPDRASATNIKVGRSDGRQPVLKHKTNSDRASATKIKVDHPVDTGSDGPPAARIEVDHPIDAGSDGPHQQGSPKPASSAEIKVDHPVDAGSDGPPTHRHKGSLDRASAADRTVDPPIDAGSDGPHRGRKHKSSPKPASSTEIKVDHPVDAGSDGPQPTHQHKGSLDRASAADRKVDHPIDAGSDGPHQQGSPKPASATEVKVDHPADTGSDGPQPTHQHKGSLDRASAAKNKGGSDGPRPAPATEVKVDHGSDGPQPTARQHSGRPAARITVDEPGGKQGSPGWRDPGGDRCFSAASAGGGGPRNGGSPPPTPTSPRRPGEQRKRQPRKKTQRRARLLPLEAAAESWSGSAASLSSAGGSQPDLTQTHRANEGRYGMDGLSFAWPPSDSDDGGGGASAPGPSRHGSRPPKSPGIKACFGDVVDRARRHKSAEHSAQRRHRLQQQHHGKAKRRASVEGLAHGEDDEADMSPHGFSESSATTLSDESKEDLVPAPVRRWNFLRKNLRNVCQGMTRSDYHVAASAGDPFRFIRVVRQAREKEARQKKKKIAKKPPAHSPAGSPRSGDPPPLKGWAAVRCAVLSGAYNAPDDDAKDTGDVFKTTSFHRVVQLLRRQKLLEASPAHGLGAASLAQRGLQIATASAKQGPGDPNLLLRLAVGELLQTEKTYVSQISAVVHTFQPALQPLVDRDESHAHDAALLFANTASLLRIHKALLQGLERHGEQMAKLESESGKWIIEWEQDPECAATLGGAPADALPEKDEVAKLLRQRRGVDELQLLVAVFKDQVTARGGAAAVFEELDSNRDGLVSFDEFWVWARRTLLLSKEAAVRVFEQVDNNEDGHIKQDELNRITADMLVTRWCKEVMRQGEGRDVFARIDKDQNSIIDMTEFTEFALSLDFTEAEAQTVFSAIVSSSQNKDTLYEADFCRPLGLDVLQSSADIGELLQLVVPLVKSAYTSYANNFEEGIAAHERLKTHAAFTRVCRQVVDAGETQGLDLADLLITPIQRMMRYSMLLQQIHRHIPCKTTFNAPLAERVHEAITRVTELTKLVDASVTNRHNYEKLKALTKEIVLIAGAANFNLLGLDSHGSQRKLLKKGVLTRICRSGVRKQCVFYLFSDCLLYVNPRTKKCRHIFDIEQVDLLDMEDQADLKFAWMLQSPKLSFVVCAVSAEEKSAWATAVLSTSDTVRRVNPALLLQPLAPVWQTSDGQNTCTVCDRAFNLFRRKHHCYHCGCLVCRECSRHKFLLPSIDQTGMVQVCDVCFEGLAAERETHKAKRSGAGRSEDPAAPEASFSGRANGSSFLNYPSAGRAAPPQGGAGALSHSYGNLLGTPGVPIAGSLLLGHPTHSAGSSFAMARNDDWDPAARPSGDADGKKNGVAVSFRRKSTCFMYRKSLKDTASCEISIHPYKHLLYCIGNP
ncbi:hypothetical protein DIPPA_23998 [Diplonema papillatum]|nr:hypothetical protein DIPPA_23998 [Diplonema papillatum]